jgi:hypothetical protein
MAEFPRIVTTSVVRAAGRGDSHGGVCIVDPNDGTVTYCIDWNRSDIDVDGRGGDRGLRGIAFYRNRLLIASSTAILEFDRDFTYIGQWTCRYLKHCHEVAIDGSLLYITSTGFDSIIVYDLDRRTFVTALHLMSSAQGIRLKTFDPMTDIGPAPSNSFHLNNVVCDAGQIFFSGLRTPGLLKTDGRHLTLAAKLPKGTHNARLFGDGVLFNDTQDDCSRYKSTNTNIRFPAPEYPLEEILNINDVENTIARPYFARGLCIVNPSVIAAGFSPSTVALYSLTDGSALTTVNISMDVRNSIHGLELWPW